MKQMYDLITRVLAEGTTTTNRTGIATTAVFGHQMRFHLQGGFPLMTRKYVPFKLVASELLWFLKGEQDKPGAVEALHADNNHIWDEWAKPDGSFGPIYGVQWRRWGEDNLGMAFDQIKDLIEQLKSNPESRRLLVTAWQPDDIADMALPPCHVLFQLNCRPPTPGFRRMLDNSGRQHVKWVVDLQLYQRSCDVFLGVPFNIASYALLLHLLCHCAGEAYTVGDLVWTGGNVHIYENHVEQCRAVLHRDEHPLPRLILHPDTPRDIDQIALQHLILDGYVHSGVLKGEVAV